MKVEDVMKKAFVIDEDMKLKDAAKIMSSKAVGSLIFLGNDKVKGIVTDSDLLKHFGKKEKVSQIMSKDVITINPGESIDRALELMQENKIKRLPVIDNKETLEGIITLTDIAAHCDELEEEFFFE